ncbi:MAG: hypothetical protein OEV66_00365 [Spirochaetia bacterium]|nr:hypothetical protein [Spirochaetia bacterium]
MLELSIPFLASVIITILLRRLDKSSINLRKLKTLIERGQKELVDIALQKKEELKDASTQLDLLLINSDKYLGELKSELTGLKNTVSEVQGSRAGLLEMDGELQSLELTTNSVKDQLRYINESLDKIDQHQKKIKNLQEYIKNVDNDASKMVKSFQKAIGDKSEEVVRLMEAKLNAVSSETHDYQKKLRDELLEKHGILSHKITESYKELEGSLRNSARGLTATIEKEVHSRFSILDDLDVRISANEKLLSVHLPDLVEQLKLKFQHDLIDSQNQLENLNKSIVRTEDDLRKRFEKIHAEIDEERNTLFQNFIEETDKIRDQIHSLDYDTLAKKDELIRSVKEEASKIQGQITSFEKIYDHARENIYKQVNAQEEELANHLVRLQLAIQSSLDTVNQESDRKKTEIELFLAGVIKSSSEQMASLEKSLEHKSENLAEKHKENEEKVSDRHKKFENFVARAMIQVEETSREKDEEFLEKISQFEKNLKQGESEIEKRLGKFEKLIETSLRLLDSKAADKKDELSEFVDNEFDKVKTKIDYFHELFNENSGSLTERVREKEDQLLLLVENYKKAAENTASEINIQSEKEKEKLGEFITGQLNLAKSKFDSFQGLYETGMNQVASSVDKAQNYFNEQLSGFEYSVQNTIDSLIHETGERKKGAVEFFSEQFRQMETKFHELNKNFMENTEEYNAGMNERENLLKEMTSRATAFIQESSAAIAEDAQRQQRDFSQSIQAELKNVEDKLINFQNTYSESIHSFEDSLEKKDRELESRLSHMEDVLDSSIRMLNEESGKRREEISAYADTELSRFDKKIDEIKTIYEKNSNFVSGSLKVHESEINQLVDNFRDIVHASVQQIADEAEARKDEIQGYTADQFDALQSKIETFNKIVNEGSENFQETVHSSTEGLESKVSGIEEEIKKVFESIHAESQKHKKELSDLISKEIKVIDDRLEDFAKLYQTSENSIEENFDTHQESLMETIKVIQQTIAVSIQEIHDESDRKKAEIHKYAQSESAELNAKISELDNVFNRAIEEIKAKVRENDTQMEIEKGSLEKSIRSAIDQVFDESEDRKNEFIKSAEEELGKFHEKMGSFQSVYNESIENIRKKSEMAADEVNGLISGLNTVIDNAMAKFENLGSEEMEELQVEINKAVESVQKRAEEVFQESYDQFVFDVKEFREEFNRVQNQIESLESVSEERYKQLNNEIIDVKSKIQDNLSSYVQQIKKSAKDLTEVFEKDLSGKLSYVSKQIESLEGEIETLRNRSVEEIEGKVSPLYSKLGNIEKNLLESQKHLMDKWSEETAQVMKKISEKEILFSQSAEKWETQFEAMTRNARDSVHKGFVDLEKKRTDLLDSFDSTINQKMSDVERFSGEWSEKNEKTLSELISSFKLKMQEKEDSAFDKMQQMSARFGEIKKEIQTRHDSVLEVLQAEKSSLEKEMKQLSEKQLQLFNMEMDGRIEKTAEMMQTSSDATIAKIEKEISGLRSEFKEIEESTREMIASFTFDKKELFNKIDKETKLTAKEIMGVQEAFNRLKDEMKILDKAEKSTEKVRNVVKILEDKLNAAEGKSAEIQDIFRRVDELKEMRLKLDAELMMLAQKREKVDKLEDQLSLILNLRDEIEEKGEQLDMVKSKVQDIIGAQEQVDVYRSRLDNILEEFVQQHTLVENVLGTISGHQKSVDEISGRMEALNGTVKVVDERSRLLKDHMDSLEVKMESLKKHETEIVDVKNKFLEIEDLIQDIENRKKQIDTLRKRFEEMRISMNDSVISIEKIEHNAETKVKQLTDLINASEYTEKITSKVSGKVAPQKIGVDKKNMIIRLGEMGWSADEIASKINMDLTSIETILSTSIRQ